MDKACVFAEWLLNHVVGKENGGYYLHFSSGYEVNKLYSIVDLYNTFDKPKINLIENQ